MYVLYELDDGLSLTNQGHHGSEIDIKRSRGGINHSHSIPVSSPATSVTGYNGHVLNAGDIYNSMWSTPPPPSSVEAGNPSSNNGAGLNNHNSSHKWAQSHPNIKEEPKGGIGGPSQPQSLTSAGGPPLREILGSATNHGSPSGGNESPHPSFQYAAIANAAAASGFPTGNTIFINFVIRRNQEMFDENIHSYINKPNIFQTILPHHFFLRHLAQEEEQSLYQQCTLPILTSSMTL